MMQRYHNPFAVIDLVAPVEQREHYDRYTATGTRGNGRSESLSPPR